MATYFPTVSLMISDGFSCYEVRVPGRDEKQGIHFLEALGTGNIGYGLANTYLGHTIPPIREEYKSRIKALSAEVERRRGTMPLEDLARWASDERTRIAHSMRRAQGFLENAVLEVRDRITYGKGGRSWENIYARAARKPDDIYSRILDRSLQENSDVSEGAINGMKFLKKAGPIFIVLGLGTVVSDIVVAKPGHRLQATEHDAALITADALGTEVTVGMCVAFGLVSGGWALLAVGLIGGSAGVYLTDRFVYPHHPRVTLEEMQRTGHISTLSAWSANPYR